MNEEQELFLDLLKNLDIEEVQRIFELKNDKIIDEILEIIEIIKVLNEDNEIDEYLNTLENKIKELIFSD